MSNDGWEMGYFLEALHTGSSTAGLGIESRMEYLDLDLRCSSLSRTGLVVDEIRHDLTWN